MIFNKYYLTFVFSFIVVTPTAFAQSVVTTTGNTIQNSTISLEYSIGEIGITTLSSTNNYVTQGLLQPVYKFKDCSLLKMIPNSFTPNNDNKNDCFGVKDWPGTSNYELSIFNRWGQQVFKTNSVSSCWDGSFNGQPQSTGTFVYFIRANNSICGAIASQGTVVLIR